MKIVTNNKLSYSLTDNAGYCIGNLQYETEDFAAATLQVHQQFYVKNDRPGTWTFYNQSELKVVSRMKVVTGGKIRLESGSLRHEFRKTSHWYFRFVLYNKEGEELLAIKPVTNWDLQAYEFLLQINDDLSAECNSFLILQAIHCAICSMGMMYDKTVPPIVSIF